MDHGVGTQRDYKVSISDTLGYVRILIEGYEKNEAEYYFDNSGYCDSISIKYYCSDCVEKHLRQFLKNRNRKWKQIEEGRYISSNKKSIIRTEEGTTSSRIMTVKKMIGQSVCAIISFYTLEIKGKVVD